MLAFNELPWLTTFQKCHNSLLGERILGNLHLVSCRLYPMCLFCFFVINHSLEYDYMLSAVSPHKTIKPEDGLGDP